MAALQHDSNGFLKGDRVEPAQMVRLWGAMREDLSAIRKALEGGVPMAPSTRATSATVASPRVRSQKAQGMPAEAVAVGHAVAQAVKPVVQAQKRNASGRFVGKNGPKDDSADDDTKAEREGSRLSAILSRAKDFAKGAGDAEDVDSSIKAANEIARPMARGYELLMGDKQDKSDKKHERWYRRIFTMLKKDGEDSKKDRKTNNKLLKSLDAKPVGGAVGRGGFLSNIVQGLGGGMGAGMLGAGAGLLKGGAAIARSIPLIGGLMASIGGAWEMWQSETSGMARADKDRASGKALGGVAGTLGGMFGGAKLGASLGALAGPIGAAIGGVVGGAAGMFFGDKAGQVLGETVGGWVAQLREVDIGGMFKEAVATFKGAVNDTFTSIKTAWDSGLAKLSSMWEGVSSTVKDKAAKANSWIKETTGVDVGQKLSNAGDTLVQAAKAGKQAVVNGAQATANAVKESTVGKGVAAVANTVKEKYSAMQGRNALLNEMSDRGITDPKERAMIMAQLDHESGGFKSMEESFNYRSADRVMAVSGTAKKKGKAAVEAAMKSGPEALAELMYGGRKDLGNVNPGDGYLFRGRGQTQLTGRANYQAAGKALGLDLENNPDLVADPTIGAKVAMWYWNSRNVGNAARAGDVEGVTRKINGGLNGLDDRKALYSQYLANPGTAVSTSIPVASAVPSAPAIPTPAPAPKVPVQVASSAGAGRGFVNPSLAEPGQDLQERRLAHIATGGYSG